MKKIFFTLSLFHFFNFSLLADDCIGYKTNPTVTMSVPDWHREVVQPLKPMDLWHGNVVATLVEDYEITADTTALEDGFCIGLKSVNGVIGYSDFQVSIDSRHIQNSCPFNAVLTHEDEHIRTYLSVIDDYKTEILAAVTNAANSVMPVFITTESDADGALDALQQKIRGHPELILMNQKILAEQEIRNKRLDQSDTSDTLKQCF